MELTEKDISTFIRFQREEITAYFVYKKLASVTKNDSNRNVLLEISAEELKHYGNLKRYTHVDVRPRKWDAFKYYWLARILGLTFAVKLMELGEQSSQLNYAAYKGYSDLEEMAREEESHEDRLIAMINEERLYYMGAIVLGLNDALVEFTGALAGYTLALNDNKLIALTGSITGIAAALSMASSEYLSTKSEGESGRHPKISAVYTGLAYIVTVAALIAPFIFIKNVLIALGVMLAIAILIIALFNYYYAIARGEKFRKRFGEMAVLSMGVALISFLIGILLKKLVGIEA